MNLNVGDTVVSGQNRWQVVGVFEANGGVAETEIWCDVRTLQGVYRRGNSYQSLLAQLETPDSFDTFRDWLTSNPQLNVSIRRENEYYAGQSQTLTRLIQTVGFAIAGLMGIGAVFGAILTMYTAVATRALDAAAAAAGASATMKVCVLSLGCAGGADGLGAAVRGARSKTRPRASMAAPAEGKRWLGSRSMQRRSQASKAGGRAMSTLRSRRRALGGSRGSVRISANRDWTLAP